METLVEFYRTVWLEETVPQTWKEGLIFTLYKGKGSRKELSNYRGITLLNVLGKIYTGILSERLKEWIEEKDILVPEQAGFRKGYGTVDNGVMLNYLVEREIKREGKIYACFVDFEKAFDSIDRAALWEKLRRVGVPTKFIRVLQSLYERVVMKVCVNESECTGGFLAERGLRQGCKLSPLLFAIFVNDLPNYLTRIEMHTPYIANREVGTLMYADDLVLMSQTAVGLQRGLNCLSNYCDEWKLRVNVKKTKVVVFRKSRTKVKMDKWMYRNERIERVSEFLYLGLLFQENGRWKKHQEASIKKAETAMNVIWQALFRFNHFPVQQIFKLFDSMIAPVTLYGAEVWGGEQVRELTDELGIKVCKGVLGVGRGVSNDGVLDEVGRINLSEWAEKMWLTYAWKLGKCNKGKLLQKLCLERDTRGGVNVWKDKLSTRVNELGLDEVWRNECSEKEVKTSIKECMLKLGQEKINNGIRDKKSLEFYLKIREENSSFYVGNLDRKLRSNIAWARLGGFL